MLYEVLKLRLAHDDPQQLVAIKFRASAEFLTWIGRKCQCIDPGLYILASDAADSEMSECRCDVIAIVIGIASAECRSYVAVLDDLRSVFTKVGIA